MHTEVTRRDLRARRRIPSTSPASRAGRSAATPPATTSVSIGPRTDASAFVSTPETARPSHDAAGAGDERHGVGPGPQGGRTGEHLGGPDGIERLAALEDDDDHVAGVHHVIFAAHGLGSNAPSLTISATGSPSSSATSAPLAASRRIDSPSCRAPDGERGIVEQASHGRGDHGRRRGALHGQPGAPAW